MASFNIGRFRNIDNGDLVGSMATATVKMTGVRLLKLRKSKESQPDFRIISQGGAEMGACWEKASKNEGLVYLGGYFDAPELPAPVNFAMFEKDGVWTMTWSRPKPKQDDALSDDMGDFGSAAMDDAPTPEDLGVASVDPFAQAAE